jgi:formylglycine-generating enzyme required for sulfatase activity
MHEVTIGKPFAVGKFEVTLDEWGACVVAGDCSYKANGVGKHPVSNVSWYDITNGFLPWLSRTAGRTYRLLTEAEWEYAARAGTTTPFSTGRTITPEQANFDGREGYENDRSWYVPAQFLWPVRHAWQRFGMGRGLLQGQLCQRAIGRLRR